MFFFLFLLLTSLGTPVEWRWKIEVIAHLANNPLCQPHINLTYTINRYTTWRFQDQGPVDGGQDRVSVEIGEG